MFKEYNTEPYPQPDESMGLFWFLAEENSVSTCTHCAGTVL
jgi:hypothetical protein